MLPVVSSVQVSEAFSSTVLGEALRSARMRWRTRWRSTVERRVDCEAEAEHGVRASMEGFTACPPTAGFSSQALRNCTHM